MREKREIMHITKVIAREILDSRGNPTIEVDMHTDSAHDARASIPSGASTGMHEACELRDGGKRFHGKGILKAVKNIDGPIAKAIQKEDIESQEKLDSILLALDTTPNKKKLGANALLAVSLAGARALAMERRQSLHTSLQMDTKRKQTLPVPFCNIINGGKHAGGKLAFQEFMIAPIKARSFAQAAQWTSETYHTLKGILEKKYGKTAVNVGDEGGFAPPIASANEALDLLEKAIAETGYRKKIAIAMDPAASEFYQKKGKAYAMPKELTAGKLLDYYCTLFKSYPIISLEDPFEQDDYEPWIELTKKAKKLCVQIVGDDLLVTNVQRIMMADKKKLCDALLLKVNQIGTLSEAISAARLAFSVDWNVMVSHRSGETTDTFISDLAVALGCGQIKLGAPCRGERTAKYNQLLRIEEELGDEATYARW